MHITVQPSTDHDADAASDPAAGSFPSDDGNAAGGLGGHPGVAVVVVDGEIDLFTGPHLREQLQALLVPTPGSPAADRVGANDARGLPRAVVIDLLKVTFMDSYALGVLVWAHKTARAQGRSTALVADSPIHTKLFDMTGLNKVMPLHRDLTSALASLP